MPPSLDTLAHQRDLLTQQIAAQEDRTTSERNRLVALIHGLEAESSQLESQIAIQEERIRISEDLLQAAAKLNARRNMSESEYRERQESNLQHKQALSVLGQQLAEHRNRLTETRYALEQLPTVMAERSQTLRNDLAEAEQRIAEINGRRAYVLRAPSAGRVATLQATVGRTADPRHLQLEIVPADSVLRGGTLRSHPGHRLRPSRAGGQDSLRRLPVSELRHLSRADRPGLADDPQGHRSLGAGDAE